MLRPPLTRENDIIIIIVDIHYYYNINTILLIVYSASFGTQLMSTLMHFKRLNL